MASSARAQAQDQDQAQHNKTVTGYPVTYAYAVPPPQTLQVEPTYYQAQRHQNRRFGSTLLCRLIFIAIAILSLMALGSFITWLVFRPQVPEFRLDSASVSQLKTNLSESSLTATWQFSLSVKNPNKKLTLSYSSVQASVLYGDSEVGVTQLAPFSQDKRNETSMRFELDAVGTYVDDSVVNGIEGEKKARGEVGFGVRVYGWVRFKAGWWKTRWRGMRVSCGGVNIKLSNNNNGGSGGSLVGRVDPCRVYM